MRTAFGAAGVGSGLSHTVEMIYFIGQAGVGAELRRTRVWPEQQKLLRRQGPTESVARRCRDARSSSGHQCEG